MAKCASDYRYEARGFLENNWKYAVLFTFVIFLIVVIGTKIIPILIPVSGFISLIFFGAFDIMLLKLKRYNTELELAEIFSFFKQQRLWLTMALVGIYTYLWSLLLIIPGIIKAYSYSMTAYILYDNPDLNYDRAIDKSIDMMHGQKWNLFCLDLSFIGWAFLCMFTFGIGYFWLVPYMEASRVAFYENLKNNNASTQNNNKNKFSFHNQNDYENYSQPDISNNSNNKDNPFDSKQEKNGYDHGKY